MFVIDMFNNKTTMPTAANALPGREQPLPTAEHHAVSGRPLSGPYPAGLRSVYLGMGSFWAAEKLLWQVPGVWVTVAGYCGGFTPNPTRQEVGTGLTGHAEVVKVVFDPQMLPLPALLALFFERHDPTQAMRQGNDIGTAYRSVIYLPESADLAVAEAVRDRYAEALKAAGHGGRLTTQVVEAGPFYPAETAHQQYLARNPHGRGALRGTGIACPPG